MEMDRKPGMRATPKMKIMKTKIFIVNLTMMRVTFQMIIIMTCLTIHLL